MRYLFGKSSLLSILAYLFALCFASMAAAGTLTLTVGDQTNPTSPVSFSVNEGQTLTFQVVASDTDSSKKVHLQGSNLPSGASLIPGAQWNPRSATFSWTPSYNQKGSYTGITFTAAERGKVGVSKRATVNITGGSSNHAPVLQSPGDKTVNEGETLSFALSASDQDVGDVLTYGAGDLPQGATLDPTGRFTWTPGFDQAGSYVVTLRVTDNGQPALGGTAQITITVGHVNRPPVMSDIGSFTVSEGQTLSFQAIAQDPDGDTLAFSAQNVPDGASFDPTTQMFTWSPTLAQSGNYQVTFSATDCMNGTASKMATITVNNVNRPPTLDHIGSQRVYEGVTLTLVLTGQDLDGGSVTYSAENLPEGATFAGQTFTWSPTSGQVGAYDITFRVTDSGEPPASASEIVHIIVNAKGNIQTFTVTYSSGGNGTITCASPVNYGSSSTCAISPANGYRLASITDNGTEVKSQISGSTYTISTVAANHSISVGFELDVTNILWQHGSGYLSVWYMNGATMTSSTLLTPNQVADTGWKVVGPK